MVLKKGQSGLHGKGLEFEDTVAYGGQWLRASLFTELFLGPRSSENSSSSLENSCGCRGESFDTEAPGPGPVEAIEQARLHPKADWPKLHQVGPSLSAPPSARGSFTYGDSYPHIKQQRQCAPSPLQSVARSAAPGALTYRRPSAPVALQGPLAAVHAQVLLQLGALGEGLPAHAASKGVWPPEDDWVQQPYH